MKLTPWFDRSVKPVRVGWYERLCGGVVYRDWFDGYSFLSAPDGYSWTLQELYWRGLAQQPKGKK